HEQRKEYDGQLASEGSRLAKDNLSDEEQENAASTAIGTKSNKRYLDVPEKGQDESQSEFKLADTTEPHVKAILDADGEEVVVEDLVSPSILVLDELMMLLEALPLGGDTMAEPRVPE
ncbi:hypothetical protein TSMEX_004321, partial [Taenia solium]